MNIFNARRKQYVDMGFSEDDLRSMGAAINARQLDIQNFEEIIRSAEAVYRCDPTVALILREELTPYFGSKKTLGQSVPVINERIRTYLAGKNG